jgi:predicted O-methyltransferase YrrM
MYDKQLLLYNSVKNAKNVLEIGTYMGHSLLIMLLSNPKLKITCIDISDEYTRPAVKILNKYFNNAITFIHNDSLIALKDLNIKFDFFHIDGRHDENYITKEFEYCLKLNNSSDDTFKIIFDDLSCLKNLQYYINNNYNVIKNIIPDCNWNNIFYEIQL